jgi:hypothetical protein
MRSTRTAASNGGRHEGRREGTEGTEKTYNEETKLTGTYEGPGAVVPRSEMRGRHHDPWLSVRLRFLRSFVVGFLRSLSSADGTTQISRRGASARPGPLEVEAADAAVDVEHLSDQIETGTSA